MPELLSVYDNQDDIPETVNFRELFTERNGKFELTGVGGIKTAADVQRLTGALDKEKNDHKETRTKLSAWSNLGEDPEKVQAQLDKIPTLEAASKDKLDQAEIDKLVDQRVESTLRTKVAPIERQLKTIQTENQELKESNGQLVGRERTRKIHDSIRKASGPKEANLLPSAVEDALTLGERIFEIAEDGEVVTKDNMGVTPGMTAKAWLEEMRAKRDHWWAPSQGTGAGGSNKRYHGVPTGADNPWSAEGWNMTKQGQFLREHGKETAEKWAKAAGTRFGGPRPEKKKAS